MQIEETTPHDNGRGRPCSGAVEVYDGEDSGTCNRCGAHVTLNS